MPSTRTPFQTQPPNVVIGIRSGVISLGRRGRWIPFRLNTLSGHRARLLGRRRGRQSFDLVTISYGTACAGLGIAECSLLACLLACDRDPSRTSPSSGCGRSSLCSVSPV
jgi:hypothetical protein